MTNSGSQSQEQRSQSRGSPRKTVRWIKEESD